MEDSGEAEEESAKRVRRKQLIEASLFMAPGTLTLDELARISNTGIAEARIAVNELTHDYWERGSAVEVIDEPSGIRMAVKKSLEESVSSLAAMPEVHKGAMKTLAYIAYKQPVKQPEVIRFRNTKAYDHIQLLEEKGFIRREKIKNSYTIYTTKKFHEYFGNVKNKQALEQAETMEGED